MQKSAKSSNQTYTWEGMNKRGEATRGEMQATSMALAKAELRRQGIRTKKIRKKSQSILSRAGKKVAAADITIFSRQMATMMQAGIPLVQSFDIVGRGATNPAMTKLVSDIKNDVESGTTFSEALAKHPKYFNELFCNLVDAGEQSGSLETMLDRLATYKEKTESLKAKIKKALFYPLAVLAIAFLVSAGLLIFVVPQFEELFKGFGADLPTVTQVVIDASEFFQAYWWLVFGILGGVIVAFVQALKQSKKFAHTVDRILLKLPLFGPILEKAAVARFARTLSITFAAGMPLVDALITVAGSTGNIIFNEATDRIRTDVSTGQQLQQAMRATNLFPNMVIQMVSIGEESGALETMLGKVADFYEEEVDNAVDGLSTLIEPLIMAILGILVGGLVVAMYMPIFKLGSIV